MQVKHYKMIILNLSAFSLDFRCKINGKKKKKNKVYLHSLENDLSSQSYEELSRDI